MISSTEIIEIFSYTSEEQKTFAYLRRYMNRITKKLREIEHDREKLKRFALAGLFLTYRTFNHSGSAMTTEVGDISSENIHFKRLGALKDYFALEIRSAEDYLSLMRLSKFHFILMMFRLTDISKTLYHFVVK
jgi:hypothetical protein